MNKKKVYNCDRFIPCRIPDRREISSHLLKDDKLHQDTNGVKNQYDRVLYENMFYSNKKDRILSFTPRTYDARLRTYHPDIPSMDAIETPRTIPVQPERILDAPDLVDDFYLNLLDWSNKNIVAIALSTRVFFWNDTTHERLPLIIDMNDSSAYHALSDVVTSVSFNKQGNLIAMGSNNRNLCVQDLETNKTIYSHNFQDDVIGSLDWNNYILTCGTRGNRILSFDVRNALVSTVMAHTDEVCKIKWDPHGRYLVSGRVFICV